MEILKEADTIHEGIGLPDWKLVICLAVAWICIVTTIIKGIAHNLPQILIFNNFAVCS
jgi:solute carrier family 6 amino acid transporter-like protein 5/7/9/14